MMQWIDYRDADACVKCGQTTNYSHRTFQSEVQVEVGAGDKYEARCRQCFVPHADTPTLWIQ